jgi:hypothetical protein
MLHHLREVFIDKLGKTEYQLINFVLRVDLFIHRAELEQQRADNAYCLIKWSDTKRLEIIQQNCIRLQDSEVLRKNVTYTIFLDNVRRHGTVLAMGTSQVDLINCIQQGFKSIRPIYLLFIAFLYFQCSIDCMYSLGTTSECQFAREKLSSPAVSSFDRGKRNAAFHTVQYMR